MKTTILGIESSCDETAAAVVVDGHEVIANQVATQVDLHRKYGGVVPEIAARAHIENIIPILRETLAEARKIAEEICSNGPLSIRALMRMLREVDESYSEAEALQKELEIGGPVFASKDAREGPRAFAEKRKPVYRGE